MLADCGEVLVFGTHGQTIHSMVGKQTGTSSYETDNIVMWVIRHSIVDWVYSKTQNLLEILNTLKSTICSHKVDV